MDKRDIGIGLVGLVGIAYVVSNGMMLSEFIKGRKSKLSEGESFEADETICLMCGDYKDPKKVYCCDDCSRYAHERRGGNGTARGLGRGDIAKAVLTLKEYGGEMSANQWRARIRDVRPTKRELTNRGMTVLVHYLNPDIYIKTPGKVITYQITGGNCYDDWVKEKYQAESFDAELKRDSCCCGATVENPCLCMEEGVMECSAVEPKCPCYVAKGAESFEAECKHENWETGETLDLKHQDYYTQQGLYWVECNDCGAIGDQFIERPADIGIKWDAESFDAEDEEFLFIRYDVRDGEREYSTYTILDKSFSNSSNADLIEWMYGGVGEEERDGEYWVDGVMLVSVGNKGPISGNFKSQLNNLGLYAESFDAEIGEILDEKCDCGSDLVYQAGWACVDGCGEWYSQKHAESFSAPNLQNEVRDTWWWEKGVKCEECGEGTLTRKQYEGVVISCDKCDFTDEGWDETWKGFDAESFEAERKPNQCMHCNEVLYEIEVWEDFRCPHCNNSIGDIYSDEISYDDYMSAESFEASERGNLYWCDDCGKYLGCESYGEWPSNMIITETEQELCGACYKKTQNAESFEAPGEMEEEDFTPMDITQCHVCARPYEYSRIARALVQHYLKESKDGTMGWKTKGNPDGARRTVRNIAGYQLYWHGLGALENYMEEGKISKMTPMVIELLRTAIVPNIIAGDVVQFIESMEIEDIEDTDPKFFTDFSDTWEAPDDRLKPERPSDDSWDRRKPRRKPKKPWQAETEPSE